MAFAFKFYFLKRHILCSFLMAFTAKLIVYKDVWITITLYENIEVLSCLQVVNLRQLFILYGEEYTFLILNF